MTVAEKLYGLVARFARTLRLQRQARWLEGKVAELEQARRLNQPVPLSGERRELARRRARWQAGLPQVRSPGGWPVPPGVLPAWSWTPPPGITPRLDRVPGWVRAWYRTPFADRYACAWMWQHGGFDVVPPEAWSPPFGGSAPRPS